MTDLAREWIGFTTPLAALAGAYLAPLAPHAVATVRRVVDERLRAIRCPKLSHPDSAMAQVREE